MKKTKRFDYAKYGQRLIKTVERIDRPYCRAFWNSWASVLEYETDDIIRAGEQWRRIYYTAKRQQRQVITVKLDEEILYKVLANDAQERKEPQITYSNESKKREFKPDENPTPADGPLDDPYGYIAAVARRSKPQVEYNYVDTADQLSELTQKVDACLSKLEELADIVNIKCRNRIVL
jgi:hypothetical protein